MKILKTAMILTASAIALSACSETPVTQDTSQSPAQIKSQDKARQSYLNPVPGAGKLTPERINASPSLSGPSLRRAAISPDGKMVTVLQGRKDDAQQQDLWGYDLETGEGRLLVSSTDLLGAPEALSAAPRSLSVMRPPALLSKKSLTAIQAIGCHLTRP